MKIIKFNNYLEIVLFVIMVVLFLVPFEVNNNASLVFENVIGKILVAIIILCLFTFNPLLGLMSVLLAFKLFNLYNNDGMIKDYIPSKEKKDKVLKKYNDFPLTLEENVINNLKDYKYNNNSNKEKANFKPKKCKIYNAKTF